MHYGFHALTLIYVNNWLTYRSSIETKINQLPQFALTIFLYFEINRLLNFNVQLANNIKYETNMF